MKYKLTNEIKEFRGHTLHRIEALKDFGDVKAGDKGGWVASEDNLSHNGNCWVYDNAQVCEGAWIFGNARVYGNAEVYGNSWVFEYAQIFEYAKVYENARVYENVQVSGNAHVFGGVHVFGNARVYGNARVFGDACVDETTIFANNGQFGIVVSKTHIIVGCHIKPRVGDDTWGKVTPKQADNMGLKPELFKATRSLLKSLCKLVPKNKKGVII